MLEIKITIEAAELSAAINNLAAVIAGTKNTPVSAKPAPTVAKNVKPVELKIPTPEIVQEPVQEAPVLSVPVPAPGIPVAQPPKYTVDQIMAAGATLMDAGKVNELIELLHSFGVQAVTDLKSEQLGAFATALRNLGAKI